MDQIEHYTFDVDKRLSTHNQNGNLFMLSILKNMILVIKNYYLN